MIPIGHIIIIICLMAAVKCNLQDSILCNTPQLSEYQICKPLQNLTSCFQHNTSQSQLLLKVSKNKSKTLEDIVSKFEDMLQEYKVKYNSSKVIVKRQYCKKDIPSPELLSCYDQFLTDLNALSKEMKDNCVRKNPYYASTDDSYREKWKIIYNINFQYIEKIFAEVKSLNKLTIINGTSEIFNMEYLQSYLEAYKKHLQLNEQMHDVEMFHVVTVNYIDPIIFTVIVLIGIGGNVSLLTILIRNKHLRTAANIMFINLTISDLLFLVVHLIIYKMGFILPLLNRYFSNDHQVYAYYFFILFTTGLVVYSVVVISVQRYCVLYTSKNIQKYNISFLLVGSVWVLSALLAIPDTELVLERGFKEIQTLSFGNHNFQFIAYGIVPSFVIAVFYCAAARKVPQKIPGQCTTRIQLKKARARSVRILHFLTALFIVTYIPSLLFILVLPTLHEKNQTVKHVAIIYIAKCLMFLNSSCDPIMLYIGSEKFRKYFKQYFLWFSKETNDTKACVNTDI